MTTALEFGDVRKKYGRRVALDGLTMSVPAGSLFGLVGSNGAGKTTAMSIVAGIVRPDGGIIRVLEAGGFDPAIHAGRVTLLPQDAQLPREARVAELMYFYAALQGVPKSDIADGVTRLLKMVHLEDRRNSAVRTLSHGMMRRLTIAQAFLGDPELVLLDEPLSGLDPRESLNARHFLQQRRKGQTVIISSHNLNDIERLCDRVAFIEKGRTVLQDSVDAVTGRSRAVQYHIEPGKVDMASLGKKMTGAWLSLSDAGDVLTCRFSVPEHSLESVNAAVLRCLIDAGVGIKRVQPGDGLEQAYFARTEAVVGGPAT